MIDKTNLTQEQKDEIVEHALDMDVKYSGEFRLPPIIPYYASEGHDPINKNCSGCSTDKPCCEPSDPKTQVDLNDRDIYWDLYPVEVKNISPGKGPAGNDKVISIEWGWTAGLTKDELQNYAEDAPDWKYSVKTTLEFAEEFYEKLGELIKKMKVK